MTSQQPQTVYLTCLRHDVTTARLPRQSTSRRQNTVTDYVYLACLRHGCPVPRVTDMNIISLLSHCLKNLTEGGWCRPVGGSRAASGRLGHGSAVTVARRTGGGLNLRSLLV